MKNRNNILALAIAAALAVPAAADAQMRAYERDRYDRAPSFNYIEANYHRVDVDDADEFSFSGSDGWQVGGAIQVWEGLYAFGEYSEADQDLDFELDTDFFSGDFDLVRWRAGLGYAMAWDKMLTTYGQLSWDRAEFNNLTVNGVNVGSDEDDGFGAELGVVAALAEQFQLQGWVRYTSVGEIDVANGGLDDDYLVGGELRWFLTQNFALQAGYEWGEISTWNAGLRFGF
jgi:hypothetical protein